MSLSQRSNSLKPKRLPRNGTIGVIAPATTPDLEKLNKGIKYFESLGYRVEVGKTCTSKLDYLAGDDALRASEIMQFFEDPRIDIIMCARGGYGGMHLLPLIDFDIIAKNPKLFIGYSDITALQWGMLAQCNLRTLSGPMMASDFGRETFNSEMEDHFWNFMDSGHLEVYLPYSQEREVNVEGDLIPGNLAVAAKQMSSPWFPDLTGTIPVFEDVDEPMHKIEGYLRQFALSGAFEKTNAAIFGDFSPPEVESFDNVPTLKTIFERVLAPYNLPYATGINYGHIDHKISLPVGAPFSLSLGPETILRSTGTFFSN
jgi:muramoyltetrapeptide carboxypeptidase